MAAPKNATPAQIINRLRKAEVELANGKLVKEVCKGLGISEQTFYRWQQTYGWMGQDLRHTPPPHGGVGWVRLSWQVIRVRQGPDPFGLA